MGKNIAPNVINEEIGFRIKILLEQSNESAKSLAQDIEIQETTLSKIVNGNQAISPDQLIHIAKHFGVSTDYLLGLTEEKTIYSRVVKYLYDDIKIFIGKHPEETVLFHEEDFEIFLSKKGFGMKLTPKIVGLLCSIANLQNVGSTLRKSELIERIEDISREYSPGFGLKDQSKSVFYRLISEHDLVKAVEKRIKDVEEFTSLLDSSSEAAQLNE